MPMYAASYTRETSHHKQSKRTKKRKQGKLNVAIQILGMQAWVGWVNKELHFILHIFVFCLVYIFLPTFLSRSRFLFPKRDFLTQHGIHQFKWFLTQFYTNFSCTWFPSVESSMHEIIFDLNFFWAWVFSKFNQNFVFVTQFFLFFCFAWINCFVVNILCCFGSKVLERESFLHLFYFQHEEPQQLCQVKPSHAITLFISFN